MDFSAKSYKELQQLCKQYQLKAVGNQETLVQRLVDYLSSSTKDKQKESFIEENTKGM
jgi:hypothetical protein